MNEVKSSADLPEKAVHHARPQTIFSAVIIPVWEQELVAVTPSIDGHAGDRHSISFSTLGYLDARQNLLYHALTDYCESRESLYRAREKTSNDTKPLEDTVAMYRKRVSSYLSEQVALYNENVQKGSRPELNAQYMLDAQALDTALWHAIDTRMDAWHAHKAAQIASTPER